MSVEENNLLCQPSDNNIAVEIIKENVSVDPITSNVVGKKALRREQLKAINYFANVVCSTFGPKGSDTMIIKSQSSAALGANTPGPESCVKSYSKDGHTVLKSIRVVDPIHNAILSECIDITHHVEMESGDGTSSAMKLASLIFTDLCDIEDSHETPYDISRSFKRVVEQISKMIYSDARDIDEDDIRNICMISTNGNAEISDIIAKLYEKYGKDVYIDVVPGRDKVDAIKEYNGMTIDVPYSDAAYINSKDGTCTLTNARVFYFNDPIDTRELGSFFEKIIMESVFRPYEEASKNNKELDLIPTVVVAPHISRDMASLMETVVSKLYEYNKVDMENQKPPFLVITNLGPYQDQMYDVARLCGCKPICKYIDDKAREANQKAGRAPTLDTIMDFCGYCGIIESGAMKTKFINPADMYNTDDDGNVIYNNDGTPSYTTKFVEVINSLEGELQNAINDSADANKIGNLKRRINSLKGNMIDYVVGGVSQSDRDNKRYLIEDCVLSCRAAAKYGVGFAANFEGLYMSKLLSFNLAKKLEDNKEKCTEADRLDACMATIIADSYYKISEFLYTSSGYTVEEADDIINNAINKFGNPMNIRTGKYDGSVLTSINTDAAILDGISKIVLLMFTANQAILPSAVGNKYIND